MARKAKRTPITKRPDFLALQEALPTDRAELVAMAREQMRLYGTAIEAGHMDGLPAIHDAYEHIVARMNGGTLWACRARNDAASCALERELSAPAGQVPDWGQAGSWLLEVAGMRVRVETIAGDHLSGTAGANLLAVDFDRPFLCASGWRQLSFPVAAYAGLSYSAALRLEVERIVAEEGTPTDLPTSFPTELFPKSPAWLVDALAGVTRDGQMALFAESAPKKAPLSAAERQKRLRDKRKKEREESGARAVLLSNHELAYLWWAVDVCQTARADLKDRESEYVRELLTKVFKGAPWFNAGALDELGKDPGIINGAKYKESEARRGWRCYKDEEKLSRALSKQLAELKGGKPTPNSSYSLSFRDMRALAAAALHYPRLFGDAGAKWRKDHYADLWRRLSASCGDAPSFAEWTPEQLNAWAAEAADAANTFTPKAAEFAALERDRAAVGRQLADVEARSMHQGFIIEKLQERLRMAGVDDAVDGIPIRGDYIAEQAAEMRALPSHVREAVQEHGTAWALQWLHNGQAKSAEEAHQLRARVAELEQQAAAPAPAALTQDDQSYLWWAVNIAEALRDDNADPAPIRERQARLFAGSWQLEQYGLDALGDELAVSGHVGFLQKEVERAFAVANALREQMAAAKARHEREESLLINERTEAYAAAERYKNRLQAAGLSTDYRRQPGE